ncbi:MAG: AMP-dependent synthetase/ligase [Myxococcaceae bacterium]
MTEPNLSSLAEAAETSRPTGVMAYRKQGSAWTPVEWSELRRFRRAIAAALHARGVRTGERVALISHTCWEWGALDLSIGTLGAVTIGIYPTSTPDQVRCVLEHSGAKVVFIEEALRERLQPVLAGRDVVGLGDDLRALRAEGERVLTADPELPTRVGSAVPSDAPATWVYTSGTSGPPKAAVLTHRGVLEMSRLGASALGAKAGDVAVSYLPMAHVLTRVNYYAYVRLGGVAWFAESLEKVSEAWVAARPSIVSVVPRVLEKAQAKILARVEESPPVRQKLFARALRKGLERVDLEERREAVPLRLRLECAVWNRLVSKKLKHALGWDRARFVMSGGAPARADVLRFFHALGLPVLEGYGLTETSSPVSVNVPGAWKIGTVGRPLQGVELKLADDGEILVRSPGVFVRYEGDEAATRAAFEPDGFFRTGDVGVVDAEGFLRITDRKRDLIITAGGKNVAPQNLEALVREDPNVSLVAVHGDRQPYLVALVTLQPELVARHVHEAREGFFPEGSTPHRLALEAVAKANARLGPWESIKKVRVPVDDFTVDNGLLTPTLKVKRRAVEARYRPVLDALYA